MIWVPADSPAEPRLIDGSFALVVKPPPAAGVETAIRERVSALLRPPLWQPRADRRLSALLRWWRALPYRTGPPYRQFLAEGSPQARGLAASYRLFLGLFAAPTPAPGERSASAGRAPPTGPPPEPSASAGSAALRRIGERCDRLALYYSACHRSAFLGVYLFAALALILAVLGIAYQGMESWGGAGEVVSLSIIAALVLCDRLRRWHDRWIDYRSIAEVLRQSAHLTALGRTLPNRALLQLTRQPAPHARASDWTAWYLQALLRQIPAAAARYDRGYLDRVRTAFLDDLIAGQIAYYHRTGETARRVSEFLAREGFLLFALTIVFGLVKLGLLCAGAGERLVPALALLAAVFPVASAAFIGLRAQAEFEVIASGSLRLAERLKQRGEALRRLDLSGALSSEHLASAMFALSRLMLGEVEDWAILFDEKRIKAN